MCFSYISSNGIAGTHGKSICSFLFACLFNPHCLYTDWRKVCWYLWNSLSARTAIATTCRNLPVLTWEDKSQLHGVIHSRALPTFLTGPESSFYLVISPLKISVSQALVNLFLLIVFVHILKQLSQRTYTQRGHVDLPEFPLRFCSFLGLEINVSEDRPELICIETQPKIVSKSRN